MTDEENETVDVTLVHLDDWAGIYVDGVLKAQNHSLRDDEVLEAVGIIAESVWLDGELDEFGNQLPQYLRELNL